LSSISGAADELRNVCYEIWSCVGYLDKITRTDIGDKTMKTSLGYSVILCFAITVITGCAAPVVRIPITLRSLHIEMASIEGSGGIRKLADTELRELEHKISRVVLEHLLIDGPFRAPDPGEAAYDVYADFKNISAGFRAEDPKLASAMRTLFGLPIGYVSMSGYGVFKINSPDGNALVHETITRKEHQAPISLYRGKKYEFPDVVRLLVEQLRAEARDRKYSILTNIKIKSYQNIIKQPLSYEIDDHGRTVFYFTAPAQINKICPSAGGEIKIKQENNDKPKPVE
jgi:hypothetical protein